MSDGLKNESNTYEEFCAEQKRKGLIRILWKCLPKIWEEELNYRDEIKRQALLDKIAPKRSLKR